MVGQELPHIEYTRLLVHEGVGGVTEGVDGGGVGESVVVPVQYV